MVCQGNELLLLGPPGINRQARQAALHTPQHGMAVAAPHTQLRQARQVRQHGLHVSLGQLQIKVVAD